MKKVAANQTTVRNISFAILGSIPYSSGEANTNATGDPGNENDNARFCTTEVRTLIDVKRLLYKEKSNRVGQSDRQIA